MLNVIMTTLNNSRPIKISQVTASYRYCHCHIL